MSSDSTILVTTRPVTLKYADMIGINVTSLTVLAMLLIYSMEYVTLSAT